MIRINNSLKHCGTLLLNSTIFFHVPSFLENFCKIHSLIYDLLCGCYEILEATPCFNNANEIA